MLDRFDDDNDCSVAVNELRTSNLISSLLAPDVDMLDESGNVNPGADGVKDALSIGFGFSAVKATFPAPL